MIIQTTKPVQKLFDTQGIGLPDFANPFACWHAMLFTLNHRKVLLLTHNESLYSVVINGVTKKEMSTSFDRIRERLKLQLMYDEFPMEQIAEMLRYSEHFSIFKSSNKSVMSSMNSFVNKIKMIVHREGECNEVKLSHILNRTPLKRYEFDTPTELLEMTLSTILFLDENGH